MNMKKTIAAVAACAMAVSAMATTVSAVAEGATEKQSVHYDLTKKEVVGTADFTFVAQKVSPALANGIGIYVADTTVYNGNNVSLIKKFGNTINVTINNKTTGKTYNGVFTSDVNSKDYDGSWSQGRVTAAGLTGVTHATATNNVGTLINVKFPDGWTNVFAGGDCDVTVTFNNNVIGNEVRQDVLNTALTAGDIDCALVKVNTPFASAGPVANVLSAQLNDRGEVKKSDTVKPFKTSINPNGVPGASNILTYLEQEGVAEKINRFDWAAGKGYKNVKAVVNDMVANYDDVVFTFNTATDNVLTASKNPTGLAEYNGYYTTGVPTAASWMGDDGFKSFPQHLYNLYGSDPLNKTYSDAYTFNNLFNSALIANNGWTMNQNTVTPFEYSKTSVSFSWADLTGGNAFVTVAGAIESLQLATSTDWYWDSMDITAYELAADDASSDAGAEDDSTDLDEDTDTDADDDATIDDDTDVDADDDADVDADVDADADADVDADVDADADADADAADETTDANPGTGNAPIALAVIPVALAAAAVVAKKRG